MTSLDAYLSAHRVQKDSTHTRMSGGAYNFAENESAVYGAIYKDVILGKRNECLTEKQRPNGTLAIDLDFRYAQGTTKRQHTPDTLDDIMCIILDTIAELVTVDAPINVYIMEKPNVNQLADLTKDGIHFIFTVSLDTNVKSELRSRIMAKFKKQIELPLINTVEDVFDEGIMKGTTNWMIYGCRKPNHEVYNITKAYNCVIDHSDNEWQVIPLEIKTPITENTFRELSVRTSHHKMEAKIKINVEKQKCKTSVDNNININKLIEFSEILSIEYIDKYPSWRNIVWSLLSDNQNNKSLAQTISKRSNKYNDESFEKLCDSFRDGHYSISTFYAYCKDSDKDKYFELMKKYDIPRLIELNDLDDIYLCSVKISKTLKDTLVLCDEQWYAVDSDTNIWCKIKSPDFYVSTEIRKYIDYTNWAWSTNIKNSNNTDEKDKIVEQIKLLLKYYKTTNTTAYRSTVITYLKSLLRDNHFYQKLNSNPYMLAFKNGVVDLKTGIFRRGIYASDYITETIPSNYAKYDSNKYTYVKNVIKQIMNNNEEHCNYFLSLIGYSFIGVPHLEKSMYFMIDGTGGKGDNGKSLLFDILTELAPCYVYKSSSTLLEKDNVKAHKQLVNTKGKRLVWLDEFSKTNKINSELMKLIGDGKQIENEIMFGTTEHINVLYKMFILSNFIPKLDATQQACYNRYKQVSFCSHFDRTGTIQPDIANLKFKADPGLCDALKQNYVNEIWGLIIEYAHKYCEQGMPNVPEQFLKDASNTQKKNDKFKTWFDDNMEISANKRASLEQMVEISDFKADFIKEEMERLGFKYDKDLCKLGKKPNGKYYKGGYIGCIINNNRDDEDESNNDNNINNISN
jgi:phage/plasmid-associated DNA primase